MKQSDFYKVGAEKRQDQVIKIGVKNYLLIFGYGIDEDGNGYNWRKNYSHKPSKEEVKSDIDALINSVVDAKILSGMEWQGMHVWLSAENQMNFKAAYDLAVQSVGATLPIKFKIGEDAEGNPQYYTFEDLDTFGDFYMTAVKHVTTSINDGWAEKDGVDYSALMGEMNEE